MRAFLNDEPEPENDGQNAQDLWSRRDVGDAPTRPEPSSMIKRGVARIGFASFERACVALTATVVLAGCAIMFGAAFNNPNPAGEAAIEPSIIVAKREMPIEEQAPPVSASAQPVAAAPAPPPSESLAPSVSLLSQTPIRESAREALAKTAAPAPEAAPPAEAAARADALGYADATKTDEPVEPAEPAKAAEPVESAKAEVPAEPARDATKQTASAAADEAGKPTNCFVKVVGRVLNKGGCRVSHKGSAVVLVYGGSSVTIAPQRGREYTLSVGGRPVGKVYKSGGACWGSRNHTWVCERGV